MSNIENFYRQNVKNCILIQKNDSKMFEDSGVTVFVKAKDNNAYLVKVDKGILGAKEYNNQQKKCDGLVYGHSNTYFMELKSSDDVNEAYTQIKKTLDLFIDREERFKFLVHKRKRLIAYAIGVKKRVPKKSTSIEKRLSKKLYHLSKDKPEKATDLLDIIRPNQTIECS